LRPILESKYGALLEERLAWRSLVSYVGNRNEPVLCWFRYKESFSAELVSRRVLNINFIYSSVIKLIVEFMSIVVDRCSERKKQELKDRKRYGVGGM
jgi:hypothetical protein